MSPPPAPAGAAGRVRRGSRNPLPSRGSPPSTTATETGRISRAEYGRSDAAFRNLDRDRSGVIDDATSRSRFRCRPTSRRPFILVRRFAGPGSRLGRDRRPRRACSPKRTRMKTARSTAPSSSGPESRPGPDRFAPLLAAADADKDGKLTRSRARDLGRARDRDDDGRISVRERLTRGPEPKTGWFEPAAREQAPDFTLPLEEGPGTRHARRRSAASGRSRSSSGASPDRPSVRQPVG